MAKTTKTTKTRTGAADAPRWQVVENVVAALERVRARNPDMTVTQKAQVPRISDPTKTREIDVLVTIPHGDRVISIGVDVKNHGRPMTLEQMGALFDKRRKVRLDRYCVVSTSGFTEDVPEEARLENVELLTLEEFERSDFWANAPGIISIEVTYELLNADLNYPSDTPEHVIETLRQMHASNFNIKDATIENETGKQTIYNYVNSCVLQAANQSEVPPEDQRKLLITTDMKNHKDSKIRYLNYVVPAPETIVSLSVCRVRKEFVTERRFRATEVGVELSTSSMKMHEIEAQVTMATVPRPDGTKELVLSIGPANPPKQKR